MQAHIFMVYTKTCFDKLCTEKLIYSTSNTLNLKLENTGTHL